MTDGIYFADPELPFHVWVRERAGADGYKWVLRDASAAVGRDALGITDPKSSSAGVRDPSD